MIVKVEYSSDNVIKYTMKDSIEKIDSGTLDDGTQFINLYKVGRKKDDDFETITIKGLSVFIMNNEGRTLQIFRGK